MPDHWGYVAAAYLLAAVAVGAYWRHLAARARALRQRPPGTRRRRTA